MSTVRLPRRGERWHYHRCLFVHTRCVLPSVISFMICVAWRLTLSLCRGMKRLIYDKPTLSAAAMTAAIETRKWCLQQTTACSLLSASPPGMTASPEHWLLTARWLAAGNVAKPRLQGWEPMGRPSANNKQLFRRHRKTFQEYPKLFSPQFARVTHNLKKIIK